MLPRAMRVAIDMRFHVILGILLVVLGALWILDLANVWQVALLSTWWPSLIVIGGLLLLATGPRANLGGATLFVLGGGVLQLWKLGYLADPWPFVWPVVLLAIGVGILAARIPWRSRSSSQRMSERETTSVFSDLRASAQGQEVRSGNKLTAVFGRLAADLRGATMPEGGASIEGTAAFGELDVTVPAEWRVVLDSSTPVFGSIDDRTTPPAAGAPVLRVKAVPVFGQVRIHN